MEALGKHQEEMTSRSQPDDPKIFEKLTQTDEISSPNVSRGQEKQSSHNLKEIRIPESVPCESAAKKSSKWTKPGHTGPTPKSFKNWKSIEVGL